MAGDDEDAFRGVVTAADVYGKIIQVGEQVAIIAGKVDVVGGALVDIREVQRDHESRLRTVEAERWPHGKLTLVLAGVGMVVAVLGLLVKVA